MIRTLPTAVAVVVAALAVVVAAQAAAPRELRPFRAETMDAIRKSQAGKPYVLTFWSIHCEPCREEMAVWRSIRRQYPGLRIVLVSTDSAAERVLAEKFLARYDPGPVETWMFDDEFTERVRYAVDPAWRGELPRTYLFDAAHRAEARSGKLDERALKAWLARVAAGTAKGS
jgi:thiol-disulfide isomerase/thioredoxin